MQSDHLTKVCDCVVQYISPIPIEQSDPNKKSPGYETVLTWLVISEEVDGGWTVSREELRGSGPVDYVALEPGCKGLYLASEVIFKPSKTDTEEDVVPKADEGTNDDPLHDFEWQQTYDDIKIWLPLPVSNPLKDNVNVVVKSTELTVSYKGETVLSGKLLGTVDPLLTTWSVLNNRLEITLQKYLEGTMWPGFIESDKRGKEILDPAIIEDVNARLAHITSDKEEEAGPLINAMEECDASGGESRTLTRFERSSLVCTNKVHLGYQQWLLTVKLELDGVPAFCIRNDVDGCVWSPGTPDVTSGDWKVEHVGTLLAFGYVQASKTNRKFSVAPPDLSYVAIVEVTGHVIIYKKGVSVNTTLRNRRTGRQLKEIAVQQLVNLHTTSSILGAVATDKFLFVLTSNSLHLLHVAS